MVKKSNRLKKFTRVEIDVKCMQANFDGHDFSGFQDLAPFCLLPERKKFPFRPWTIYSPWSEGEVDTFTVLNLNFF